MSKGTADRLDRLWPVAAAVGAVLGYLYLREGAFADLRFRASASAVGAMLILARAYAPPKELVARAAMTLLVVGWAASIVGSVAGRDITRMAERGELRLWSHYHYYLGAKYFEELGYSDLYDQTLAVDAQNDRRFADVRTIRDLTTYDKEPTDIDGRSRSEAWSDDRWEEFSADVLWFQERIRAKSWRNILRDRGFNATPTGGTLYRLSAQLPLSQGTLTALGLIDPLLLLVAFVVVGRVFGPVKALLAAAWMLIFFGNEFHTMGGPILHDYLVALLLMACAVHRGRPMMAGMLLGYAAMVRVFPGFLLIGLAAWTLAAMRRDRIFPKFTNRFGRGVLAAVAVLFVVGCFSGRGPKAWLEWSDNISLHSEHHRFGDKRLGLQHPFTHDWSLDRGDWRSKVERRATWPEQKTAWLVAALAMCLLWAGASWRAGQDERDPLDSLVFAFAVVFAGIVLSRYYWTAACLFFLLGGRERDGPREGWLGAGLLGIVALEYWFQMGTENPFGRYVVANLLLGGFLVLALAARATLRAPPEGVAGVRT